MVAVQIHAKQYHDEPELGPRLMADHMTGGELGPRLMADHVTGGVQARAQFGSWMVRNKKNKILTSDRVLKVGPFGCLPTKIFGSLARNVLVSRSIYEENSGHERWAAERGQNFQNSWIGLVLSHKIWDSV